MKIYLAAPFFNEPQKAITARIRRHMTENGHAFYDPMMDSGSADFSPEQRRHKANWQPIFRTNADQIRLCGLMICVVEYALPEGQELAIVKPCKGQDRIRPETDHGPVYAEVIKHGLEIPDTGSMWEMGGAFFAATQVRSQLPCVAFSTKPCSPTQNLMLSFGCAGVIVGWEKLEEFLTVPTDITANRAEYEERAKLSLPYRDWELDVWRRFSWSAVETFEGEII